MSLEQPVPGLVIRYSFLWSHEARAGAEEGSKDRPCAVLLTAVTRSGSHIVTVLPITHRAPEDPRLGVEIPAATKRRLGLDGDRSWIILSEANRFSWPGPDIRTVPDSPGGTIAYGLLPAALYDLVRVRWLEAYDRGETGQVGRTE